MQHISPLDRGDRNEVALVNVRAEDCDKVDLVPRVGGPSVAGGSQAARSRVDDDHIPFPVGVLALNAEQVWPVSKTRS